jgi:antitoxin component HigA of HigAB toxin-antitoxin module
MKAINKIDKDYLRLISQVPLLPIETEQAYLEARELLSQLIEHDEELSAIEIGYARVLKKLIQDYSNVKCQGLIRDHSFGSEILQSLMDDHKLTQTDIAELTGMQKQNVNAYLKNKRALPREARDILGKRFKVSSEIFTFRLSTIDTFPDPDEDERLLELKSRKSRLKKTSP